MKKLILSIAAAITLTAVFIVIIWSANENDTDMQNALTSHSEENHDAVEDTTAETVAEPSSNEITIGKLFLPYKELIGKGVYKLVTTKQRLFGGNSVPVITTTYYGNGFINIIEEEGHGLATETLINDNGTYCFDASSNTVYLLPHLSIELESIPTDGLVYLESGNATIGTSVYTYEKYATSEGKIFDYLFLGEELKKLKIYSENDYELISVQLSADVSDARSEIPEGAVIVETP